MDSHSRLRSIQSSRSHNNSEDGAEHQSDDQINRLCPVLFQCPADQLYYTTVQKLEKSKCSISLIAVMIGRYNPKIKSRVDPEIPGSTMAEIAITPAKNTNTASPGVR